MNRLLPAALGLLTLTAPAAASECYSIRDPDKRQECLAVERREPADCASIRSPDDRAVCRQRSKRQDAFGRQDRF